MICINYQRSSLPYYRLAQAVSKVVASCVFQATANDLKKIRSVTLTGDPVVIYSADLMYEDGKTIYRCVLEDGKLAMKSINMMKIFFELKNR